jgi:hypothetical protein
MARKKTPGQDGPSEPASSFPIYLLVLGSRIRVVFPEGKEDIGHCDFWERTVAQLVADHYRVPARRLLNLPYCQRRARVCGHSVYYGGKPHPVLLRAIRKALGEQALDFVHDDHERRLRSDVLAFRRLIRPT